MHLGQVFLAMFSAYFSKSATIRIGDYHISATDTSGSPVHLNASHILLGYEQLSGTGNASVQSGSTNITVKKIA
jgi:hypothetical protein